MDLSEDLANYLLARDEPVIHICFNTTNQMICITVHAWNYRDLNRKRLLTSAVGVANRTFI